MATNISGDRSSLAELKDSVYDVSFEFSPLGKTTSLHTATQKKLYGEIEAVIKTNKIDINAVNESGDTALHIAIGQGNIQSVEILINGGAKTDVTNSAGQTPLEFAESKNQTKIVNLLKKPTLPLPQKAGNIFQKTIGKNIARFFGDNSKQKSKPVKKEKVPKSQDEEKKSVHVKQRAALRGSMFTPPLPEQSKEETVNEIEQPQEIDSETPLHKAVRKWDSILVEDEIKKSNDDINSQNQQGDTPLHVAAALGNRHVLWLLIDHGANTKIKNNEGHSLVQVAQNAQQEEIIESFTLAFHRAVKSNQTKEQFTNLLDQGFDPNALDNEGRTPLHIAVIEKNVGMIDILVDECKADLNKVDKDGKTPLDTALYNLSNDTQSKIEKQKKIVTKLMEKGAESKFSPPINKDSLRRASAIFEQPTQLKNFNVTSHFLERFSFLGISHIVSSVLNLNIPVPKIETLQQSSIELNASAIEDGFTSLAGFMHQTVYTAAAWVLTSCAVNHLLASYYVILNPLKRRIMSDAIAGAAVLSAGYFGGIDVQQSALFALGMYSTELLIKNSYYIGKFAMQQFSNKMKWCYQKISELQKTHPTKKDVYDFSKTKSHSFSGFDRKKFE